MAESVRRTDDHFDQWAKNWATGMRIAAPMMDELRTRQRAVMVANRARGAERPCGIAGCKRHSYKGRMCRKHYEMVPHSSKIKLTMACFDAQIRTAARHHARMLRELRATLKDEPA